MTDIYSSKKDLLNFLEIKGNFLYSNFTKKYRKDTEPKKSGGVRTIMKPNASLKKIQRKILKEILYTFPQLPCVYGLSKEKKIINNAKLHQTNFPSQLLILDIRDFFPNISNIRIEKIFKKIGFNKENSVILTKLCTINKQLPQGAPTSPYLASLVCHKIDKVIYQYCNRRKFIYSRYFDDISISGELILPKHITHIKNIIYKNGFDCKAKKETFYDLSEEKIITGIVIKKSGLSVPDSYKDQIRESYLKLLKDDDLKNKRVFDGKFGFYLHVNKKEALDFLNNIKR